MVLPHTHPGLPANRRSPPARQLLVDVPPEPQVVRDVTWDRPVFRPPSLKHWRVIFDPCPFRHHDYRRPPR
jgi:hypothetical protein